VRDVTAPRSWERQEPDRLPTLPVPPGPVSNGEFLPAAGTAHDRAIARAAVRTDPTATRCALATDPLTTAQPQAAHLRADGALASPWRTNGPSTRREVLDWARSPTTRWSPL
jgi:hypothetical protein